MSRLNIKNMCFLQDSDLISNKLVILAPSFQSDLTVKEDAKVNDIIAEFSASDADENRDLFFEIDWSFGESNLVKR